MMDFINIIGTFFDNSVEHVVALAHLIKDLRLNKNQLDINEDLYDLIRIAKETKEKCKGYFDHYYSLELNVPSPLIGDWAIVKNSLDDKNYIYKCVVEGYWKETTDEYKGEINLVEYIKRDDIKTINGQSLLGEGDLEISHYEIANSQTDGLMSKEDYVSLNTIKNESIPQIRESINNIANLFGDEGIQAILDRYNLIAEFITNLGDTDTGLILLDILRDIENLKDFATTKEAELIEIKSELTDVKDDNTAIHVAIDQINENISDIIVANDRIDLIGSTTQASIQEISNSLTNAVSELNNRINSIELSINNAISNNSIITSLENALNNEINRASNAEASLNSRIQVLEGNLALTKHIFLTLAEYEALESYERDTLYLIIENAESGSHFGDTFPLIFG